LCYLEKFPFIKSPPPLFFKEGSNTNSALLISATLVGLPMGEYQKPPHPYILPAGEKDEIPLYLPLLKGEETPSFEKGRWGWIVLHRRV